MEELQRSQMRGDVVCMCVWLGMGGAVGNNNQNIHGKTGPGWFQGNQTRDRAPTPQLDLPGVSMERTRGAMVPGRTPSRRDGRGQRWWC